MSAAPLDAFAGCGIELEYAIVDRATLDCLPIADEVLRREAGQGSRMINDVARGAMGWSNELVMHVLEIKNQRPSPSLDPLPSAFQGEVNRINDLLEAWGAQLMPTAMHPWMDPRRETRVWPHGNAEIYAAYERIFDTRTHGWANQSMHVNLPFNGDEQFRRLHAAIRLVLPIIPALAASSPLAEGGDTGFADFRMAVYCGNAEEFPSIAGKVIPEQADSRATYEQKILAPMYDAIAPRDPDRVLRHEWLNSRGAIPRFDRSAIEIRVIDTQECPQADMAVAAAVIGAVKMLYENGLAPLSAQESAGTDALARILRACIREGERADIYDAAYLGLLGYPGSRCSAQELWRHLIDAMRADPALDTPSGREHLRLILEQGPLARRILHALNGRASRTRIEETYRRLCNCLAEGTAFVAG